jgi:hypothetical protein
MKIPVLAIGLLAGIAALDSGPAQAQVYRCDSDAGVPVYQGTPSGRNCRALDLPPLTTIPAPKLPAPKAGAKAPGSAGGAAGVGASPPNFPRVQASTQRARDDDRQRILEDELRREEARLGDLKAEYNNGEPERQGNERNYQKYLDRVERLKEEIGRSEGNIASLKRELSATRQ